MRTALTLLLALSLLTACRTTTPTTSPPLPVVLETNTITKIVHTVTIDTVYVEIPPQSAERTTQEKTSHLETDYAESDASINEDGTLSHTLHNKPSKHPIPVNHSTDTIYIDKMAEIPVPVKVPVQVERQLTRWEKTRLGTWWYLAACALAMGIWLVKPKFKHIASAASLVCKYIRRVFGD